MYAVVVIGLLLGMFTLYNHLGTNGVLLLIMIAILWGVSEEINRHDRRS
jgi:hypothetical protein